MPIRTLTFSYGLSLAALATFSAPPAQADISSEYAQTQQLLFKTIGWPTAQLWCTQNGGTWTNNTCSSTPGTPQSGILATFAGVATTALDSVKSAGITTCASFPTTTSTGPSGSGSVTGLGDYTFTSNYAPATHTIPADLAGGGTKYTDRLNITATFTSGSDKGDNVKVAIEFVCGSDEAMLQMQAPFGGGQLTLFLWTDNTNADKKVAEMDQVVRNSSDGTFISGEVLHFVNLGGGAFTLNDISAQSQSGVHSASDWYGYKTALNATSATEVSAFVLIPTNGGQLSFADMTSNSNAAISETPTNYNFSVGGSTGSVYRGCVNFISQVDPSSAALCSNLPLNTPAAPYGDTGGSFSFQELGTTAWINTIAIDF